MAAWPVTGIRQAFPDAKIVWAVQSRCQPVIASPQLATTVDIYKDGWSGNGSKVSPHWATLIRHCLALRKHRFEYGFDLHGHFKTALCLRLSGAKRRIAARSTDPMSAKFNPVLEMPETAVHEVELGLKAVQTFLPIDLPCLPIMPGATSSNRFDVVIQTGAGQDDKRLPPDAVYGVASGLAGRGLSVALIGGEADPDPTVPGVSSLVGKVSLHETLGIVRAARLHIGGDTGTSHIASAYGVPTVAVFGRTDPARYRPFGTATTVLRSGTLVTNVSADEILRAALESLEAVPSAH